MPELPEVETVRTGLQRLLPGRVIREVDCDFEKSFLADKTAINKFLLGAEIVGVRRRAKVLLIDLSSGYTLVIHLKMTGQLVFVAGSERFGAGHPNDSLIGKLPDKTTRVIFALKDGAHLFFNDQRKFGWVKLVETDKVKDLPFMQKVGPEPLEADFTWQVLRDRLKRKARSKIKAALLDQSVLAGVGNIYADESLWGAKIHPETAVGTLTDVRYKSLHQSIVDVLKLSIEKGGSTDRNYVDAEGKKGSYLVFASVFRRESQPCPRCGETVVKTRVVGRGTHLCPNCQKKPLSLKSKLS